MSNRTARIDSPSIDTDTLAAKLRERTIIGNDRFLITRFTGSMQEGDLSNGSNCQGIGRVHHFRSKSSDRWIANPLPQEVAAWKLRVPVEEVEDAQVFQNAACNWRCWYCFVDFDLLSALTSKAEYKSADELIELFLQEKNGSRIIDLSGGQPDIIPEWPIRMMETLTRRNLDSRYFLWLDDNLSVYYAWEYLTPKDFALMKTYANFGRVGCFKGFSPESFHENTMARPELLKRQIDIMSRWVELGIDIYGYITLTTSELGGMRASLRKFMDDLQNETYHSFLLRVVPLEILPFTPTIQRMKDLQERSIKNQYDVLAAWLDELDSRYSQKERELPIYMIKRPE
jgi:uncharacterized Fe-S cluster-containing radical SAM superfamily protein